MARDAGGMTGCVEIQVACGSADEAASIADALVAERLAACVQVTPIGSTYRWQGSVAHDDEHLLVVKTRTALAEAVRDRVLAMHSYDLPAISWVDIAGGSDEYLAWIHAETERP